MGADGPVSHPSMGWRSTIKTACCRRPHSGAYPVPDPTEDEKRSASAWRDHRRSARSCRTARADRAWMTLARCGARRRSARASVTHPFSHSARGNISSWRNAGTFRLCVDTDFPALASASSRPHNPPMAGVPIVPDRLRSYPSNLSGSCQRREPETVGTIHFAIATRGRHRRRRRHRLGGWLAALPGRLSCDAVRARPRRRRSELGGSRDACRRLRG
jgi:hypothetical protein